MIFTDACRCPNLQGPRTRWGDWTWDTAFTHGSSTNSSTNSSIRVPDPNGQQHIWDSIRFPERDKTEETRRNMNRSEELWNMTRQNQWNMQKSRTLRKFCTFGLGSCHAPCFFQDWEECKRKCLDFWVWEVSRCNHASFNANITHRSEKTR